MRSSKGGNKQIELDSLEFLDAIASQEETHVTRSSSLRIFKNQSKDPQINSLQLLVSNR